MAQPAPGKARDGGERWQLTALIAAAAGLFPLLAALRNLDDNSLTSWAWVLGGRDLAGLWALHLAVVAAAALLSRRELPRGWRLPAVALAAFAVGIALSGEPEAIVDASRYFVQAKHLALDGPAFFFREWGRAIPAWTDLPLVPFLYGTIFSLFGEHRLPVQIFTAALLAVTAWATAGVGRLLWSDGTGARAALLLLGAPCVLVNVPLLMTDVPAMAAVTVALLALLALLARPDAPRGVATAAAIAVALLVKYSTWVLLAATCGTILLLEALRGRRAAAARGALAAAAGALGPAALALAKPELVGQQLALLAGFQWEGLRRWVEGYPSTFLFQTHPLLAVAAVTALWQGARRRDARVLVVAALPLVLFAIGVRRSRYLLPAFPMIALLAARGLDGLGDRERRFAALAAVGFSLLTVFAVFLPFLQWVNTANLQAAGRFLDARGVRAATVAVLPAPGVEVNPEIAVPLLDYHTAAGLEVWGPPQRPSDPQAGASSFRFSWEQPLAPWYRSERPPADEAARVLVSGDPEARWPEAFVAAVAGRAPDASFTRDAVFRYRTLVYVWLPAPGSRGR